MWKAKENILWFKKGDEVKEIQNNWKPYFEKIVKKEIKAEGRTVEEVIVPVPRSESKPNRQIRSKSNNRK